MYLIIDCNGKETRRLLAEPFLLIGRGDGCHLNIKHPSASRRQCHLVRRQQGSKTWYQILDGHVKASHNGTWVNGQRLGIAPVNLKNGDLISFAGATLHYEDLTEVSEDSGTFTGRPSEVTCGSNLVGAAR